MEYDVRPVSTRYWRPGDNYIDIIINSIKDQLKDGDIVTISEKAISVAQGNLVDESKVKPSLLAKFLARYWKKYAWGYFLGYLCHVKPVMIRRFRIYPPKEGASHKQVALDKAGFLCALKYGSEGGIDGSNVPYAFVALPLSNPQEIAEKIMKKIEKNTGKEVPVMVVDTDETYSICGLHLASRSTQVNGIHSFSGLLPYIFGRIFRLKQRATPIGIAGRDIDVEEALDIAELSHHAREYGAGRTVWDMAERFGVGLTQVTWEMLESVEHRPIVIVRRRNST